MFLTSRSIRQRIPETHDAIAANRNQHSLRNVLDEVGLPRKLKRLVDQFSFGQAPSRHLAAVGRIPLNAN